jgi:hypothetical protein
MKKISLLIAAGAMLLFASCKQKAQDAAESAAPEASTTAAAPAGPAVPFNLAMIRHTVKDFAAWNTVYQSADSVRMASSMSKLGVARGVPDSNTVYVFETFTDLDKAKAFAASPGLQEAMKKGGVTGTPQVNYLNVIRNDESPISTKDRILVMHKVKDFNVWLKAYDAEGKDTRASFGMVDRGLARGLVDSNMVYIEFAVTDPVKAKARGASPELKKIMTDAGVIGIPVEYMYREQ